MGGGVVTRQLIVVQHTALGDARATAECFRILTQHYADTMESPK